ncbi:hypothetical protein FACS1894151_00620 [Spirochaetia bacterium]|nr:hypothetical protein FACS1894151_00620 [Spirochaetia bacterium]
MKWYKTALLSLVIIFFHSALFAVDFGVLLSGNPGYDSTETDNAFSVSANATPWVSVQFNPNLSLFASAALKFSWEHGKVQPFLVELDRTELSWHPAPAVFLEFGRQQFSDSAGLISSGLLDGVNGSLSVGGARLSLGAFYTGFLYKQTAYITMTAHDTIPYGKELDYGDFSTYFASRRILVPFGVEFPGLSDRTSLVLNLIGQFDVNDIGENDERLHSQYLELHFFIEPADPLHFNIAAVAEMAEVIAEEGGLQASFAASAGLDWELPGALQDLLSLDVRWAIGQIDNETIGAYLPISRVTAGEIFTPGLPGLLYAKTSYTARLHKTFSLAGGCGYFIRTDLDNPFDAELDPDSDSRFLGGEIFTSLVWAPQSALRITADGGLFFPELGGAFVSDAKIRAKASVNVTVSF